MRRENSDLIRISKRIHEDAEWVRPNELKGVELAKPVVLVNGAFDVLHSGHMKIIHAAARDAGTVVCALDGDEKVQKAKGPGRPIMTWVERAVALGYMPVDYIVEINTNKDMEVLIKAINPAYRVLGSDWRGKTTRFPEVPRRFVCAGGMRTSKIEERIVKAYEQIRRKS